MKMRAVLMRRQPDVTVILENVFDPHNIAAVMRTCDAVGVGEVYAITDRIPKRKNWGYRSSRSANKWVDLHSFHDAAACMEAVRARYPRVLGACPGPSSPPLFEIDFTLPVALVFGNERDGVSEWMRSRCDGWFAIPQCGMIPSLNVSVACAVALYEMYRQRASAGAYGASRLTDGEMEETVKRWMGD